MYHFLWTVSHPVPDWRVWAKAHGISWGDGATPKKARAKGRTRGAATTKARKRPAAR